jgi:uncharacterized RDD family membrane protein YckC
MQGVVRESELEYAGFWRRLGATLIDAILFCIVTVPVLSMVYGADYWLDERLIRGPVDFLISWVLPAAAVLIFWATKGATPGKMAIAARVVDERTGGKPSTGQLVGRYFAYFLSTLPFGLGFIWVGFDPKKQGWHDKLSGTVVVRRTAGSTEPVRFQQSRIEPSENPIRR